MGTPTKAVRITAMAKVVELGIRFRQAVVVAWGKGRRSFELIVRPELQVDQTQVNQELSRVRMITLGVSG